MKNRIVIKQGDKSKASPHFTHEELSSKSKDAPNQWLLDADLLNVLEAIRVEFGVWMKPNSTYRTASHQQELKKQGLTNTDHSEHMEGRAIDFRFLVDNELNIVRLREHVEKKTTFYHKLRELGLRGIGFYDTFVHIDTRVGNVGFALWNNQKSLKKKRLLYSLV